MTASDKRGRSQPLGPPQIVPEYRSQILSAVRNGPSLRAAIDEAVAEHMSRQPSANPHAARRSVEALVDRILAGMIADMSSVRVVQFFELVVKNLLARLYHRGIHIRESEIERLRTVAAQIHHSAQTTNQTESQTENRIPLLFLPCHKSHIDYLVISYVLFRLGFALPHIAAGDNLNLPIVGWILRHNGAFFIRRQWGTDKLYNAIMKEYIETLLSRGHYIEAFIEGTRSRTGKLLQPKFGILKIVLEAVMAGRIKDVVIVPVSVGYDKVIETPSFADELLGMPKQKESLGQLLSNINILQFKWGRIDVRFGEPFSLRSFIQTEATRRGLGQELALRSSISSPSQPPNVPMSLVLTSDRKNVLLRSLGYRVLGDINKISVVMPTALVGTILLTLRGRGVGRTELVRKVRWLRSEIISKGGHVAEFGNVSLSSIVDRATSVLGDLIGHRTDLLEPIYYPLKRFELSFYRNQVIHLFVAEAIISVAMYATIKSGGSIKAQRIPIAPNLVDDVSFLSQLLKFEFVYSTGGLGKNLPVTITKLKQANVITMGVFSDNDDNDDTSHLLDMVDDTAEKEPVEEGGTPWGGRRWITLSSEERRIGRETFDFYCFLLWPFVETYWLACVSLFTILPDRTTTSSSATSSSQQPGMTPHWVDERVFLRRCQFFGRTLYHEGDLSYFESINKETLGNAIEWLKQTGIILIRKTNPGQHSFVQTSTTTQHQRQEQKEASGSGWIALSPSWVPTYDLPKPNRVAGSSQLGQAHNDDDADSEFNSSSNVTSSSMSLYDWRDQQHQVNELQQLYEHQHMPYPNEAYPAQVYMRYMSLLSQNSESGQEGESGQDHDDGDQAQNDENDVGWSGGPLAEYSTATTWRWTMFDRPTAGYDEDEIVDNDKNSVGGDQQESSLKPHDDGSVDKDREQMRTNESLDGQKDEGVSGSDADCVRKVAVADQSADQTTSSDSLSDKSDPKSDPGGKRVPNEMEEDAGLDSWYSVQPSGRLWELCEQIGRFRREGKNRRDTNTVAIRVLRIARLASLWDGSGSAPVGHSGGRRGGDAGPARL